MKRLIKWCTWEMKNDFVAGGYFAAMLLMYCIIDLIVGVKNVDILIIFEMFFINYLLSILLKVFLDDEKEYSTKSFFLRAIIFCFISLLAIIAISGLGGWFEGMPLWSGVIIYIFHIASYLTVWIIIKLGKDTQRLNNQLANFKNHNKSE